MLFSHTNMKFIFYQLVESINKDKFTHIKVNLINSIDKNIIKSFVKLKVGTVLEDDHENIFRVTGYYGEYIIVRPNKLQTHPVGEYLICKMK